MFQEQNQPADTSDNEISQGEKPSGSKFDAAMEALSQSLNPNAEKEDPTPPQKEELPESKEDKGDTPPENWEARYKEIQQQKDREVSAAQKTLEKLAVAKIADDPSYIHELVETDPALTDRIIKNDAWCKSEGIKSYSDLVKYAEKQDLTPEVRDVYEREIEPLKKGFEEMQAKLAEKEQEEAKAFYDSFKASRPDMEGELEAKVWEVFESSKLPLEDCYEFVKFKTGKIDVEKNAEDKAWQAVAQKTAAGSLSPSAQRATPKQAKGAINAETAGFLEAIGAEKTLSKYNF